MPRVRSQHSYFNLLQSIYSEKALLEAAITLQNLKSVRVWLIQHLHQVKPGHEDNLRQFNTQLIDTLWIPESVPKDIGNRPMQGLSMKFKSLRKTKQPLHHDCKKYFIFQWYMEWMFIRKDIYQNGLAVRHQRSGQMAKDSYMLLC